MIRYTGLLCFVVGLLVLLFTTAVWAIFFRKSLKGWRPRLQFGLLLVPGFLMAGVAWMLFAPGAAVKGEPGVVTKIDSVGHSIKADGYLVKLVGKLKEPGDYRVNLEGNRYFILHLPKGYQGDKPMPWLILLHGSDEDDPEAFAFRYNQMSERADKYGFIICYPIAQSPYSLWGTPHYAWNSKLDTLSGFDSSRQDDADFVGAIHQWALIHTTADPDNFNLGGLSDGALLAASIAQAGYRDLPIRWLFACGGTRLDGQQVPYPYPHGPKNVFLQLNTEDTKVLPLDTPGGAVTQGELYWAAVNLVGFWNIAKSRPLLQEPFWLGNVITGGGGTGSPTSYSDEAGHWRCVIYSIQMPDGETRKVIVYRVRGQHAWHGCLEGGSPGEDIVPNMNFPLSDIIAALLTDSAVPGIK
jgi:hypothetical protein